MSLSANLSGGASVAPVSTATAEKPEKSRSVRALERLNFFIADVQNGMGPYVTLFLKASAGWNPGQIGLVMAIGNLAGVIAQTPSGALIDHLRSKRLILIVGSLFVTLSSLSIAFFTLMPLVAVAQGLIGVAGAIFPTALAALALGLVGRNRMDRQMGKNQAINSAGNVFAAILFGVAGYYLGLRWMFFMIPILCALAILCILRIRDEDVDYELSRGADCHDEAEGNPGKADPASPDTVKGILAGLRDLWRDPAVRIFLICVVLFHFSNAALVPLVTQLLTKSADGHKAVLYTSGFMVGSQLVFVLVGALSGKLAGTWGRKPLFLIAFAALIGRAVLFTLNTDPFYLMAVQALDGLGAGIFGVVSVLIISDLTQGSGRFNAAQGAVATAVGSGAFLSNLSAGLLVKHAGYNVGFTALAVLGSAGLLLFWKAMPETLDQQHKTGKC